MRYEPGQAESEEAENRARAWPENYESMDVVKLEKVNLS